MSTTLEYRNWANVDQHPQDYVSYLASIESLDISRDYRNRLYGRLKIQPGHKVLDVGCGLGDDTFNLAHMVGDKGSVTGIDRSERMVQEATRRAKAQRYALPIEFQVKDILDLDYPDNYFDRCIINRVFMHLTDREAALTEIIRVTNPGGILCIGEPDWGTLIIDAPNTEPTQLFLDHFDTRITNSWCGRQLPRLCKHASLVDLTWTPYFVHMADYETANKILSIQRVMEKMVNEEKLSINSAKDWINNLKNLSNEGSFLCTYTMFIISAHKPL